MEPDDLLCSRNARPQKALVGRAQWKINQPPSLKRERASLEISIFGRSLRPCWDVILSILRDTEPFDAERLFMWVLGSEPDDDHVIPLPRGPRVHIIGQAPGHQLP